MKSVAWLSHKSTSSCLFSHFHLIFQCENTREKKLSVDWPLFCKNKKNPQRVFFFRKIKFPALQKSDMHEEHCLKSGSLALPLCIHSHICTHRQTDTQISPICTWPASSAGCSYNHTGTLQLTSFWLGRQLQSRFANLSWRLSQHNSDKPYFTYKDRSPPYLGLARQRPLWNLVHKPCRSPLFCFFSHGHHSVPSLFSPQFQQDT